MVDKLGGGQTGARQAFEGGLTVQTTIDARFQNAADAAITAWLPNQAGPRASLVAMDNKSGEVRAMVGGDNYNTTPFNLATQGQRQPGSAFKPFVLAQALKRGIGSARCGSRPRRTFGVPQQQRELRRQQLEDTYTGNRRSASATTYSDNAVYAQVGIRSGTKRDRPDRAADRDPHAGVEQPRHGARRHQQGVTPLDIAHTYETLARPRPASSTARSAGALPPAGKAVPGPVGLRSIRRRGDGNRKTVTLPGGEPARNKTAPRRCSTRASPTGRVVLQSVVTSGTGKRAHAGRGPGRGQDRHDRELRRRLVRRLDAQYTVAVWVGYPDELKPMETEFHGEPVAGGTYPAAIWQTS